MAYKENKSNENRWIDLDMNFDKHPITSDVVRRYDAEAVKRSLKNLIYTSKYDRPFQPHINSRIRDLLFEPLTPITAVILGKRVEDVIENFEPRARLVGVRAIPYLDRNAYNITLEFYVVNVPTELVETTIMLERLR